MDMQAEQSWIATQEEGQFWERKSCYDRTSGRTTRRPVRDVARDVAEAIAAMANADGGTVVVGLEDDGAVTGVGYPADRLQVLLRATGTFVNPPVKTRVRQIEIQGKTVIVFEADWSPDVHQLTDGRYLLRIGAHSMPFPADQIEAIKAGRRHRVAEVRPVPEATLDDLDAALFAELGERTGMRLPPEEALLYYHLAERRQGRFVLSLAALLLFGRDPTHWHPRCGIDFVKYEGTERGLGRELNTTWRERLEGPLVRLIERTYEALKPHIRERQHLVDLFFEEQLEYPTFAWQEAIVNAVGHRDYGYEGLGVEVWMFSDRLEIRSPGQLVEPVTLDRLRRRERIHASRNPRIARVLTDWGHMREQGEGIPRMFEAMDRQGLYLPDLRIEADVLFCVALRNRVVYSPETLRWLAQFASQDLHSNQRRLLACAKEHDGTFTSRAYQKLVGVDIYAASKDIKDLIRKNLVKISRKGGRIYELVEARQSVSMPAEFESVCQRLLEKGKVTNSDLQAILNCKRAPAYRQARAWVDAGLLERRGRGRGAHYVLGPRAR